MVFTVMSSCAESKDPYFIMAAGMRRRFTSGAITNVHALNDISVSCAVQIVARRNVPEKNFEESSPDCLGASLDLAEAADEISAVPGQARPAASPSITPSSPIIAQVVPAAVSAKETASATANLPSAHRDESVSKLPSGGTVVLDVEEGGIEVPSFLGKNVRGALEAAQDAGLDLVLEGSGLAREQSPQPGSTRSGGSPRAGALRQVTGTTMSDETRTEIADRLERLAAQPVWNAAVWQQCFDIVEANAGDELIAYFIDDLIHYTRQVFSVSHVRRYNTLLPEIPGYGAGSTVTDVNERLKEELRLVKPGFLSTKG